ncbi:hypothetical protein A7985_20095 [Pseudoalteromonas luteoviolacea]|uniref:Uncharacterized protein n=1 Tax=Pseudoalteromonas luteoviolacea TaxID=43657 RepID=A0A1C0TLV8_9GAMM|nr:hypothetical protein [Pseudoalteromonas luteoviolacea]MBQ4813417.1 hypothetical protein [Pseudoalteromonas luteoviolacea]OCQ19717.1 hypothetical protein A7985_20095 [Pseudoalteromonas luteoviolacea]
MATWLKTRTVLFAAAAVVSVGVFSFGNEEIVVTKYEQCQCTNSNYNNYNVPYCKREAHTSWFAWLTGGSSNAQFHYLDLLELLIGSDDKQDSSSISQF